MTGQDTRAVLHARLALELDLVSTGHLDHRRVAGVSRAVVNAHYFADQIVAVGSAEDALRELSTGHFDCMVLDLGLKDMNGFELLETVKANPAMQDLPIIIYTVKDLSAVLKPPET